MSKIRKPMTISDLKRELDTIVAKAEALEKLKSDKTFKKLSAYSGWFDLNEIITAVTVARFLVVVARSFDIPLEIIKPIKAG